MILSKFIPTFWSYMARKQSRRRQTRTADELRVELVPVLTSSEDKQSRTEAVNKIIGLMVMNIHKRGRPRKESGEDKNVA